MNRMLTPHRKAAVVKRSAPVPNNREAHDFRMLVLRFQGKYAGPEYKSLKWLPPQSLTASTQFLFTAEAGLRMPTRHFRQACFFFLTMA